MSDDKKIEVVMRYLDAIDTELGYSPLYPPGIYINGINIKGLGYEETVEAVRLSYEKAND